MLIDKNYTKKDKECFYMEFQNVVKEILPWLEGVIWECRSKIEKKEWKSKYNSYVIYDYEPFCSEGFEINLVISSRNIEYLNFIRFLYENKIRTLGYLNSCYSL